jgi:ATP-binding protein involved in chromosome partitioning
LQDARKAIEMFGQVKVEVIGLVENMSHFTCPHCQQVIDIFSSGGAERTAQQYGLEFLGSVELDPAIRSGGDRGLPVALAGPESVIAGPFFEIAKKVAARAKEIAGESVEILEIS